MQKSGAATSRWAKTLKFLSFQNFWNQTKIKSSSGGKIALNLKLCLTMYVSAQIQIPIRLRLCWEIHAYLTSKTGISIKRPHSVTSIPVRLKIAVCKSYHLILKAVITYPRLIIIIIKAKSKLGLFKQKHSKATLTGSWASLTTVCYNYKRLVRHIFTIFIKKSLR